jgi:hypothetical protein
MRTAPAGSTRRQLEAIESRNDKDVADELETRNATEVTGRALDG